jgi:hypothetical protein
VFYLTTSVAKTAIVVHETRVWGTGGVISKGKPKCPDENLSQCQSDRG